MLHVVESRDVEAKGRCSTAHAYAACPKSVFASLEIAIVVSSSRTEPNQLQIPAQLESMFGTATAVYRYFSGGESSEMHGQKDDHRVEAAHPDPPANSEGVDEAERTVHLRMQEESRKVGEVDENGRFRACDKDSTQRGSGRQRHRHSEEESRPNLEKAPLLVKAHERRMGEMEREIVHWKRESKRLREERDQAKDDRRKMEAGWTRAYNESNSLKEQLRTNGDQLIILQRDSQAYRERIQRQEQEIQGLKIASHHNEAAHSQTVALLETRTSELNVAQVFLTKADVFSGADIISIVEGLNADILETAAYMADTFNFGQSSQTISTEETRAAHALVESLLGQPMSRLLAQVRNDKDQTLVQIAIQGCLAYICQGVASAWCIFDPKTTGLNDTLNGLYEAIRAKGVFFTDCLS